MNAFSRILSGTLRTCGGFALLTALVLAPKVQAQDLQTVAAEAERLQRDLSSLQQLAQSTTTLTPSQAANMELRLSQLENDLRRLTGKIEDLAFKQEDSDARMDRLVADVDQRLQRMESGGYGGAAGTQSGSLTGDGTGYAASPEPSHAANSSSGTAGGDQTQVLGTLTQDDLQTYQSSPGTAATGQSAAATTGTLQGDTPEMQYNFAFGLLRQRKYSEAEMALRSFIDQYPGHRLAGNAKYWLGETFYVREDYEQAAITFAEAYQNYPDNLKAPDNLLKLGMALAALGSTADACGTQDELLQRYPNASPTVTSRAESERQRLNCP